MSNLRADAMVAVVTLLLVIFQDLSTGIVVGVALGGAVFIRRMSEVAVIAPAEPRGHYDPSEASNDNMVVYHLRGLFFFGAAARLGVVLDRIGDRPRAFVVDFSAVPFIDSSGARSFDLLARKTQRKGGQLYLVGTNSEVRRVLLAQGVREPSVRYFPDVEAVEEMIAVGMAEAVA